MIKTLLGVAVVCLLITSAAWSKVGGGDITFSVKGAANVVYSHDVHVTQLKNKCTDCHYRIFKMSTVNQHATMAEMQKGKSCGACHNGQRAFSVKSNCNKCHK